MVKKSLNEELYVLRSIGLCADCINFTTQLLHYTDIYSIIFKNINNISIKIDLENKPDYNSTI